MAFEYIGELLEEAVRDVNPVETRGRVEQGRRLCAFCENVSGQIVINSFLADEAAARLTAQLARDDREIERRRVGPVLGAHLGSGCVGVCFIEK